MRLSELIQRNRTVNTHCVKSKALTSSQNMCLLQSRRIAHHLCRGATPPVSSKDVSQAERHIAWTTPCARNEISFSVQNSLYRRRRESLVGRETLQSQVGYQFFRDSRFRRRNLRHRCAICQMEGLPKPEGLNLPNLNQTPLS